MKTFWTQLAQFNRRERRGILLLVLFITGSFMMPRLLEYKREEPIDFSRFEKEINHWQRVQSTLADSLQTIKRFFFDPNLADKATLVRLGLSEKTSQTIINYRIKGGRFRQEEDLMKIYTLNQKTYDSLRPYIRITQPAVRKAPSPPALTAPAKSLRPFPFDPNTVTGAELKRMNLPDKVIHTIHNYRHKGGRFRQPEDLAKIYGLTGMHFEQLRDFVRIDTNVLKPKATPPLVKGKSSPPLLVDVNRATKEEWQALPGIGPYYARRIISFREKLGGFSSIDQIGETYHLPDSSFWAIADFLHLSPVFRQLNINEASAEELKTHPYISPKTAQLIVSYRSQHGPFQRVEEIERIVPFSPELVRKLGPYLRIN